MGNLKTVFDLRIKNAELRIMNSECRIRNVKLRIAEWSWAKPVRVNAGLCVG